MQLCVCNQCNGWWELLSEVTCTSLCVVRVNVMERWPFVALGRKAMNRICDKYIVQLVDILIIATGLLVTK